jgi:hypothetical protein
MRSFVVALLVVSVGACALAATTYVEATLCRDQ